MLVLTMIIGSTSTDATGWDRRGRSRNALMTCAETAFVPLRASRRPAWRLPFGETRD
jgi:hypothetical protein